MRGAVPKLWPDATVVILAGGPSLRAQDLTPLFNLRKSLPTCAVAKIITVNDSWRLLSSFNVTTSKPFKCGQCDGTGGAPNDLCRLCFGTGSISTSAMYFCDAKWWQRSIATNSRLGDNTYSFHDAVYKCWWFTGSPDFAEHPQVNALRLTGQAGLETDPTGLRTGSNSGYQAINLAVHLGAKKIILLGYDMRIAGGLNNWHGEPRPHASPALYAQSMLPHFDSLVKPLGKLGVEVVNATPGSALETFPKATLEEALA